MKPQKSVALKHRREDELKDVIPEGGNVSQKISRDASLRRTAVTANGDARDAGEVYGGKKRRRFVNWFRGRIEPDRLGQRHSQVRLGAKGAWIATIRRRGPLHDARRVGHESHPKAHRVKVSFAQA